MAALVHRLDSPGMGIPKGIGIPIGTAIPGIIIGIPPPIPIMPMPYIVRRVCPDQVELDVQGRCLTRFEGWRQIIESGLRAVFDISSYLFDWKASDAVMTHAAYKVSPSYRSSERTVASPIDPLQNSETQKAELA